MNKNSQPRRLPYEETEAKPLELGDLLKMTLSGQKKEFRTSRRFRSSDQKSIELDELLALPAGIEGKSE